MAVLALAVADWGAAMTQLVKFATLTKPRQLLQAARHNLREIQAEFGATAGKIDAAKICLNMRLAGPDTAYGVASLADQIRDDACIPPVTRKNGVRAAELLITLPGFEGVSDPRAFFSDSLEWVRAFLKVPVLSAVVHMDESEPHMHVLLLPITLQGQWLGYKVFGGKQWIGSAYQDFFDAVAFKHGLKKSAPMKKSEREALAASVRAMLGPYISAETPLEVIEALGCVINAAPGSLLQAASDTLAKCTSKSSIEFPLADSAGVENPIEFAEVIAEPAKKEKLYLCVEFSGKLPPEQSPVPGAAMPEQAANDCESAPVNDITRELDEDKAGWVWDEVAGEWMPPAPARVTGKARAWAQQEKRRFGM